MFSMFFLLGISVKRFYYTFINRFHSVLSAITSTYSKASKGIRSIMVARLLEL